MWDRHPVRLALLHMLPAITEQHGLALATLLRRAGLSEETAMEAGAIDIDAVVARAQVCTALLHLAKGTGDAAIGLDLAAAADPARLGLAGRALFAGRTLRDCLAGHARQMPDLQGGVALRLEEKDGIAYWSHSFADSDAEHARILNDGVAAFLTSGFKAITGMAPDDLTVTLPHRPHAPVRVYEDKLDARIAFGTGEGIVLAFDAAWLDQTNHLYAAAPTADRALGAAPVSTFAQAAVPLEGDDALVGAIRRLFGAAALSGSLSLVETAQSLGAAPRTLQRRLGALGLSYEALLDEWRHAEARRHLAQDTLPVSRVARALGYGHPAHFIRAFRRWEGRTPLAFRRAAPAAGTRTGGTDMARNGN